MPASLRRRRGPRTGPGHGDAPDEEGKPVAFWDESTYKSTYEGVDAQTGAAHSMVTTAVNVRDATEAHRLLRCGESRVWGYAGCQGVQQREGNRERRVEWQVAMRPSRRRKLDPESEEAFGLNYSCRNSVDYYCRFTSWMLLPSS